MDVCTLIVPTVVFTVACIPQNVCHEQDGKKWCQPAYSTCIPIPKPFWSCRREDGSEYSLDQIAHPTVP